MSESFVDIDTSDATEPIAVDPGEYLVRIIGCRKDKEDNILRTDKNGGKYFMPMFELPNELAAKTFSHFVRIPDPGNMDEKQLNSAKWELESFKQAFQMGEGGFDLNALEGMEGYAILSKEDSAEYGEQNRIKKFVAGA